MYYRATSVIVSRTLTSPKPFTTATKSRHTNGVTRRGTRQHTEGTGSVCGEDSDDLEEDSEDAHGERSPQVCKAERCLGRETDLEMALDRR